PGHVRWAGRLYGDGLTHALGGRRPRVYHGVWGAAPFQSVYQPAPSLLGFLPQMPEWHLMTAILAGLAALSTAWRPFKLALPMLAVAIVAPVAQAWLSAARAPFPGGPVRWSTRLRRRLLTAALHLIQPLARLRGRLTEGLTPWRHRGIAGPTPLWPVTASIWTDQAEEQDQRLRTLEADLRAEGACVLRGGRHAPWDLGVRGGFFGSARLILAVEDHPGGHPMHDLTLYRRVLRQTRPYWWHIAGLLGLGVLASPIAILNPVPLKIVVDSVLGSRPLPPVLQALLPSTPGPSPAAVLAIAIGLLLGVTALGQIQGLATTLVRTYIGERLVLDFRSQLVQQVQRLSLSYHDSRGTADSVYRIQYDASALQNILVDGAIPFVSAAVTLVTMWIVTARLDRSLALV